MPLAAHAPHADAFPRRITSELLHAYPSQAFRRVVEQIDRFARDETAIVLLQGETGTGKTLLARYIHAASPRAEGPFEHVVLSALDDALASSELFGHVSGAYTDARSNRTGKVAAAHRGTLFLDEIGKASIGVQQKLLHAVEYGEIRQLGSDRDVIVDVRFVAATNVALESLVSRGSFLTDLHARLGFFRVELPPLRERRADIADLVHQAIDHHCTRLGYGSRPVVHPDLMVAFVRASWPHNLRQLDGTIHRLLVDAAGAPTIGLEHCSGDLDYLRALANRPSATTVELIQRAIEEAGTVTGAAQLLRVDRTTIQRHRRRQSKRDG